MNAVKRCLALFAATVAVGACSGDPTADLAGKDLTIRATPGVVWLQHDKAQTVLLEAIDATGAPAPGNWTVTATNGPVVVVADTAFQHTTTGHVSQGRQFIFSSTIEGQGFVVFTGTGGVDTVPVRIAPDPDSLHITISDTAPALFAPVTITASPNMVFTGSSAIRFVAGPTLADTAYFGLDTAVVTSISADSTQLTFVPAPSAHGHLQVSGIASRSTPTLTTTAHTAGHVVVQRKDTTAGIGLTATFRSTGTKSTASYLDTLVVTAPAGFVFYPSTTIEFFRILAPTTANPSGYTVSNGTANPVKVSLSADSTQMRWLVAPGARGRLRINHVGFKTVPAINFATRDTLTATFDLRSPATGTGPDTSAYAWVFNKASPIAEGDTVTVTAPAGTVFLTGTASINSGSSATLSGGDSTRITGISADSTQLKFILPPGATGKFRHSLVARRDQPAIRWQMRGGAINAVAAPAVVATMTPASANMNDTVVIALSGAGPYRFRPTSQALLNTFPSIVLSISADSLTMKALAPAGQTGNPLLTNIRYANLPTFQVQAATASTLTMAAATSLGPDDIANAVTVQAPTTVGGIKGIWDQMTMTDADPSPGFDGGAKAQFMIVHVAVAGNYTVSVNWTSGTDIDIGLMAKDGSYSDASGKDYVNTAGLTSARPEATTATLAVGDYVLALIDFTGASTTAGALSVTIKRNS